MKNKLKVKIIPSLVFGLINIVYCQVESKIYESYSDDYVVKAYDAFINDTVYTTGLWFNTSGEEIASVGNPNGIDMYENEIVLTLDQLGIEAYHNENGLITSAYHIDLEGNSRAVTMLNGGKFFVASEEAGAFRIATGLSSQWDYKVQFAKDLFVTHVTSSNNQIAVSCASNGLALYESKQSDSIEERGIHDIGYVYHSEFSNGYLFAASREGLHIFEIEE